MWTINRNKKPPYSAEDIHSYVSDISELTDLFASTKSGEEYVKLRKNVEIMQGILEHMLKKNKRSME